MSGGDDVTVVWVAPEGAAPAGVRSGPGDGREDASRALVEWGRARGLRIVTASERVGGGALRVDPSIADHVENELDRARDAISALDADAAERALARAEALLREHPELPQAAWLRAEVHRAWAARFTRIEPRDDPRAQSAWQDAEALDGGRAAGIGEVAFPPRPRATTTFAVSGVPSRKLIVRLDGAELAPTTATDGAVSYTVAIAPAEHQLVVTLDAATVFASWVAIAPVAAGAPRSAIPIHVGDDGACSGASMSGVARDGAGVHATGVTCDHWVAAAPAERRGAVLVARCARSACGPFLEWRSEGGLGYGPQAPIVPRVPAWPAWATWTAIGVGVLAATTITLVATGVFESRPTEQRFVAGGVRTE